MATSLCPACGLQRDHRCPNSPQSVKENEASKAYEEATRAEPEEMTPAWLRVKAELDRTRALLGRVNAHCRYSAYRWSEVEQEVHRLLWDEDVRQ